VSAGPGLVRAIRRWDLAALAINGIVGAGIFGLPSEVFARVGVYSLLAFVVCAAAVALIILCFAEVSSRFSGTGGPYLYAREAFGPLAGFEVGWLLWIARLTAFAANVQVLVAYFSLFVPWSGAGPGRTVTITLVVLVLTAINILGVREATRVTNVLTIAKMAPLALFVLVGLFYLTPEHFALPPAPPFADFSVSVLLLMYAFTGFEQASIPGGEMRDPRRDLPHALLLAIAVVAVFFVLIQVVAIGTLPGLGTSARPLADAGGRIFGPPGAALIAAGAVVSILGNLNSILLVAPRVTFAMAERGELPAVLAATHPRCRTPHVSIALAGAIVLAVTLSGTFIYIVTISAIARLLNYAATSAALIALRRQASAPPAQFVAPAGPLVAVLSLLIIAWLLFHVTGAQLRDAAIAAGLGLAIYALNASTRRARR
jgi:amino acid transporter